MPQLSASMTTMLQAVDSPRLLRPLAPLAVAAFALLTAYAALVGLLPAPVPRTDIPVENLDSELYRAVIRHVAEGQSFYTAAIAEQLARGFPVSPPMTVRPPVLAWLTAAMGGTDVAMLVQRLLGSMLVLVAYRRLWPLAVPRPSTAAALIFLTFHVTTITGHDFAVFHDIWAGLLVTMALLLRRPGQWRLAWALAVAASSIREIAAPILAVMIFWALVERQWREAAAWSAGLGGVAVFIGWHWLTVAGLAGEGAPTSAGWTALRGWQGVIESYVMTTPATLLPYLVACLCVPPALFGWCAVDAPLARRAMLWVWGMTGVFLVFGRSDNFYWAALIGPMLPIGLGLAPVALRRIAGQARAPAAQAAACTANASS